MSPICHERRRCHFMVPICCMLVAAACGVWYLGHRRLAGRVKGVKGPYDKKTDVRNTGQTQDSGLGKEKEKKKKEKKREKDKQPQQHDPRLAAKAQHDSDARTALEHAGRISGLPALQPSYKSGKAFAHPDHPSRVEEWSDPQIAPFVKIATRPHVYYYEGFLSDVECDHLVSLATDGLRRSRVRAAVGERSVSADRTSQQAWVPANRSATAASVYSRTRRAVGINRTEVMQVLRYLPGESYAPHHDYFDPHRYGPSQSNRAATMLLFLSNVTRGGHTAFPHAGKPKAKAKAKEDCSGLKVTPHKGSAVLFYDMTPAAALDPLSLHTGCRVEEGVKWVATIWLTVDTPFDKAKPLM